MKNYLSLVFCLVLCISCTKTIPSYVSDMESSINARKVPIVFQTAPRETKSDVTTDDLITFHLVGTTGTAGNESVVSDLNDVTFTRTTDGFRSNEKFWPSTNPFYHFYAANTNVTFAADGCTVSPANNYLDIVAAYLPNPTYAHDNTLTFNHIFAKMGTVTVNSIYGYTLSNVSFSVKACKTGGTYNLRTKTWSALSGSANVNVSDSGTLVVPGTYQFSVTYTYTRGAYVYSATKSCDVTLVQGKVNNITVTPPVTPATPINFEVSVADWGTNSIIADLS